MIPEPNSKVRLLQNVPFSSNRQNVIQFNNRAEQENYFLSLPKLELEEMKYVRERRAYHVPYSKDKILQYNYVMYQNTEFSDKWFYGFITAISYTNPNSCYITIEIDTWQTWQFDFSFQPSYVDREHCRRWNADGTPVINTIPETLDYGSEYQIKNVQYSYTKGGSNSVYWAVLVTSLEDTDVQSTNLMYGGVPSELYYIFIPLPVNKRNIQPSEDINAVFKSYVNGVQVESVENMMNLFRYEKALVGKLVGFYVTDYLPFPVTLNYTTKTDISITSDYLNVDSLTSPQGIKVATLNTGKLRLYDTDTTFPNKYTSLIDGITESKLLMYPYSYVELSDLQGNTFPIKNEYVSGKDIVITTLGSIGTSNKVAYNVKNYLNNTGIFNRIEYGIINANSNLLTIIDDYTAAYLQGNSNSLHASINASHSMRDLNNTIAENNANTQRANSIRSGIANTISGAITGASKDGAVGAFTGALSSGIQSGANILNTYASTENTMANTELRGNVQNEISIASSLAKVQDTQMVADNVHLQGGDVAFSVGNNIHGYVLISKQITPEYVSILQDYFQKYGYAVHRVKIPNLHTRESWNYIRTTGCNLTGNIPEFYLRDLESIFDSGVTVWHTTDVGNYNLSNNEI